MIPRRITLSGFLCYRDEQVIDLEGSDLWVFSGRNGSGKSAVFDAMTFALFGAHRGGKQNAVSLIHADADALSATFEFELGGEWYRIRRSQRRSGKAERQVFRRAPQEDGSEQWPAVPETEADAGFKRWVLENLGLTYETFTASVLLVQGRAETLLGAQPKERFEILAGIVDLDRFRRLHRLADERRQARRHEAEGLRSRLRGAPEIEEAAVAEAEKQVGEAEAGLAAAEAAWREAVDRAAQARSWAELRSRRARAIGRLERARGLIAGSEAIARDWARLRELDSAVPLVRAAIELRGRARAGERERERSAAEGAASQRRLGLVHGYLEDNQRLGEGLRAEIDRDEARVAAVSARLGELAGPIAREALARHHRGEIATIERGLAGRAAAMAIDAARAEAAAARDRRTEAAMRLQTASDRLRLFGELQGAAACDRCGRPLTPDQFRVERDRLDAEQAGAARELEAREAGYREAEARLAEAEGVRAEQDRLVAARRALAALGSRPDDARAEAEREALATEQEALAGRLEGRRQALVLARATWTRLDQAGRALARRIDRLSAEAERGTAQAESWRAEMERLRSSVPERWHAGWDDLREDDLARWEAEQAALRGSGVEEAAAELPGARLVLAHAEAEVGEIARSLEAIAPEARCEPGEVLRVADEAEAERASRERHRRRCQAELDRLRRDRSARDELQGQVLAVERELAVAETLAQLLGRDGLQRELLREAERGILDAANPILRELSGGELELRLAGDDGAGDPERALQLEALVRTHGRTRVHDVAYLSGSQRFRVAVSLALGIGRYARGLHRPIESVIIDEGFGCLDRQGRDEMIAELSALKGRLARIVLVSHQEEFADAFPDAYRFEIAEGTTVARAVRR